MGFMKQLQFLNPIPLLTSPLKGEEVICLPPPLPVHFRQDYVDGADHGHGIGQQFPANHPDQAL